MKYSTGHSVDFDDYGAWWNVFCCAYPSLSILYSRKQLTPVVVLNVLCSGLIPLLFLSVYYFETTGAACVGDLRHFIILDVK